MKLGGHRSYSWDATPRRMALPLNGSSAPSLSQTRCPPRQTPCVKIALSAPTASVIHCRTPQTLQRCLPEPRVAPPLVLWTGSAAAPSRPRRPDRAPLPQTPCTRRSRSSVPRPALIPDLFFCARFAVHHVGAPTLLRPRPRVRVGHAAGRRARGAGAQCAKRRVAGAGETRETGETEGGPFRRRRAPAQRQRLPGGAGEVCS
jgi:hypothetical protein